MGALSSSSTSWCGFAHGVVYWQAYKLSFHASVGYISQLTYLPPSRERLHSSTDDWSSAHHSVSIHALLLINHTDHKVTSKIWGLIYRSSKRDMQRTGKLTDLWIYIDPNLPRGYRCYIQSPPLPVNANGEVNPGRQIAIRLGSHWWCYPSWETVVRWRPKLVKGLSLVGWG